MGSCLSTLDLTTFVRCTVLFIRLESDVISTYLASYLASGYPTRWSTCRHRTQKGIPRGNRRQRAKRHTPHFPRIFSILRPFRWLGPAETKKTPPSWPRRRSPGSHLVVSSEKKRIRSRLFTCWGYVLTWDPLMTITSAAPAAVRPHVNRVPKKACITGP